MKKNLYELLRYIFLLLFFGLLFSQIYSLFLRLKTPEPWLLWDHFFLWVILLAWLRFILSLFQFLQEREYFSLPSSSLFYSLRRSLRREFLRSFQDPGKFSRILMVSLRLAWKHLGNHYFLLWLIFFPRLFLSLALFWDLSHGLSLYHFYLFLPLLFFPLFLLRFLSLYLFMLEALIISLLKLFHRHPRGDDFSYTWTQESLDRGYVEEDLQKYVSFIHGLAGARLEVEGFLSLRKKFSLPLNLFFSLCYLILWFLFFFRIFLS